MSRVVRSDELPRLSSTRDGRDRIDLVTSELFETPNLKADRITYHPGDTAAAHYHRDCEHYFFILEGNGVLHVNEEVQHLGSGDVALVEKDEVHWFENHGPENFVFIELWVPTPSDTVWVDPDDI